VACSGTRVPVRGRPLAGLVVLALGACSYPSEPQTSHQSRRIIVGHVSGDETAQIVSLLSKEGLVRTTPDGRYDPLLAESWETVDHKDGSQTVIVNLRRGVTFHDGTAFDSTAVKQFLEISHARLRGSARYVGFADIDSVTAVHSHRVDIRLLRPSSFLLDALTLGISPNGRRSIGTGPFALESRIDDTVTLVANQSYYRGLPSVDEVSLIRYQTLRTAWAAMMRNEVDVLFGVPIFARRFIEGESDVALHRMIRPYAFAVGFNRKNSRFDDPRLRRALNYAIDREAIVQAALGGDGRPASGIWTLDQSYAGIERVYHYDPQLADTLLTEAGYPPIPRGATSATGAESRFEFVCVVPEFTPNFGRIALLVQRQLGAVGVRMRIEAVNTEDFPSPRLDEDPPWDAVLALHRTGRAFSRLYSLWHSSELDNLYGYTDTDVALDTYRWASSENARSEAAQAFQERLYTHPPAIFLVDEEQARAVSRRFVVPPIRPGRDLAETLWQWKQNEPVSTADRGGW
jgi:peptide/nickel transport system substrate-binding protein